MACVDESYRRIATGSCRRFDAPAGDSFGYHPHPKHLAPDEPNRDRDEANLADLPRLFGVLDRLTRMKRLRAPRGRFPVDFTEFGYQTSPPDRSLGVPLERHARYLQQAAYISWSARRVRNLVHYQWQDEPVTKRKTNAFSGWQSGLRLISGEPKPALRAFPQPFVVDVTGRGRGRVWGQARGAGRTTVTVLRRAPGQRSFAALQRVRTDARGYWSATIRLTRGAAYGFAVHPPALTAAPNQRADHPTSGIVRITRPTARGVVAADAPR